jgi:uncharacterized zinc-type alcohol dehydrogenase-like protein
MRSVTAYATPSPRDPFEKTTIQRRDLRDNDVLIKIHYAGICHSDIHVGRGEWEGSMFPCTPGHEIAGTIEEIGAGVTKFAIGDRVGVGCMVDSCGECTACNAGEEQFCENGTTYTYNSIDFDGTVTKGGYSTHIVVREEFVVGIPEGISLDVAAPLLCAGITLYSPLNRWNAGPGKKVAILGLGGLGHVGVKLARAMGAEVSVLSHSAGKEADAKELGAHHFHDTSDPENFKRLAGHFDLIVNTVSAPINMDAYLSLLGLNGALVNVGAPPEPLSVNAFSLIGNNRSWAGSQIGGIRETQEMLNFCAEHGIGADIELIGGDQINEAWDRVVASDVRYRFVIDTATF